MKAVKNLQEFLNEASKQEKSFLLLYKRGGEQSDCAYKNFADTSLKEAEVPFYAADVTQVRDIHPYYGINSVPSLVICEKGEMMSVVKGCMDAPFYEALAENALYVAKARAEGREVKRVTVYSTPTCSWCNTLKSWLRKNKIPFTEVDVSRDERAAQDLVRRSGQQGVPQTDINGQIVVGFNQQRLKELLEV